MAGANIMNTIQAGILKPLPSLARYLVFSLNQNASPAESLQALATAFVRDQGEGMDGSSFVAAQQWLHDLDFFEFFVAFGHSLYAYEAQLKRMAGLDDGILDAIFTYSTPVTGAYFWCPPVVSGQLDLRAVSL
jgi:deferrochelatase/peroxidase EfeB